MAASQKAWAEAAAVHSGSTAALLAQGWPGGVPIALPRHARFDEIERARFDEIETTGHGWSLGVTKTFDPKKIHFFSADFFLHIQEGGGRWI